MERSRGWHSTFQAHMARRGAATVERFDLVSFWPNIVSAKLAVVRASAEYPGDSAMPIHNILQPPNAEATPRSGACGYAMASGVIWVR